MNRYILVLLDSMRYAVFAIATVVLTSGFAFSQTEMTSNGPCNQNVAGRGNTVIVNCTINSSSSAPTQTSDSFDVVISFSGGPTIQLWFRNQFGIWEPYFGDVSNVDPWSSEFQLVLDGKSYTYSLNDTFEGDFQELGAGKHRYSMTTEFVFYDGFRTRVPCRGLLDLRSSASLVPRQNIEVNLLNGQVTPIDCGFIASQ